MNLVSLNFLESSTTHNLWFFCLTPCSLPCIIPIHIQPLHWNWHKKLTALAFHNQHTSTGRFVFMIALLSNKLGQLNNLSSITWFLALQVKTPSWKQFFQSPFNFHNTLIQNFFSASWEFHPSCKVKQYQVSLISNPPRSWFPYSPQNHLHLPGHLYKLPPWHLLQSHC